MTCLPDVNVWIALYSPGHIHHKAALNWFESLTESDLLFCRVTQMGFLRLLTNSHVMGSNALSPSAAWIALDEFLESPGIFLAKEPPGLEDSWRAGMHQTKLGPNRWTDAYLGAFATQAGATLVTFDKQLASRKDVTTHLLR
jgi:toxin-antitoxin system PIN domain toxin